MASGDSVVQIQAVLFPNANAAAPINRVGGSTPAERMVLYAFDAATIEYMDFLCYLNGYDGGGLTFTIVWSATSATTNVCRWGIAIRRLQDDAEDIDTSQTYDFNDVDATAAYAHGNAHKYTRARAQRYPHAHGNLHGYTVPDAYPHTNAHAAGC